MADLNSKQPSPVLKGQLRCFHCRQAYNSKDGNWHSRNDQQVFLCKHCERIPAQTRSSGSSKSASAR